MNATGRASASIHTKSYRLNGIRIAFIATCFGGFLGCTQDEASPQVPLDPPNRSGETADVDGDTAAQGGSDSGNDSVDNQGGSAENSSASQGGADNEDTTENQGGSSESATTTSRGGSTGSSSNSKSTGSTPATGSSCVWGVNTGNPCNPDIDTEVCVRSTRDCTCGDDSTWTCTPRAQ